MSSELRKSRFSGIKPSLVKAVKEDNKNPVNEDAQMALGLVQILNAWVRAQRKLDLKISPGQLTPEQTPFLELDIKKNGCILPPSDEALPHVATFDLKNVTTLTHDHRAEIMKCIHILECSYSSWAMQSLSTMNQHNVTIAVGVIQLHRDLDKIYKKFLGENIIWKTFVEVLGLLEGFNSDFIPWHGVIGKNRQENEKQIVRALTHRKEDIGAVVGAGMARTTVEINDRYRLGMEKTIEAVHGMASHTENGQAYIGSNVSSHLRALLRVSISIIQQPVGYFRFADDVTFYLGTWSGMCPTGLCL